MHTQTETSPLLKDEMYQMLSIQVIFKIVKGKSAKREFTMTIKDESVESNKIQLTN